jgi:hypothetical protein
LRPHFKCSPTVPSPSFIIPELFITLKVLHEMVHISFTTTVRVCAIETEGKVPLGGNIASKLSFSE